MTTPASRKRKRRSVAPLSLRIENAVFPVTECGCWIWMKHTDENGYGTIRVNGKMMKAHRASYVAARGEIKSGMKVLHRCDVRCCVNPDHLFLGTQRDNVRDMFHKCRAANVHGERNPNSKLTHEQVSEIKRSALGCVALSKEYGVSASIISAIKLGKNWRHA